MGDERRDSPRVSILGELQGEVMGFQPMTVSQISRGGAQIETTFRLQLDSLHDFRLTLGDRLVVVKGRIVHCTIADVEEEQVAYRAGVEFVEPSEHAQLAIEEFLKALEASRRGL